MKKKVDGHRSGKYCGYELLPNGKISVAPKYVDEFNVIANEKATIDHLIKSTMEACNAILSPITKKEKEWWDRMCDDYGLTGKKLSYRNGIIKILSEKDKSKEPEL